MKRRLFFRTAGQLMTGAALAPVALAAEQPAASVRPAEEAGPFGFLTPPVLLNPAEDGVSVVCAVNGPATGWVEYGETEALGQQAVHNDQGFLSYEEKALRFRLQGLKPGKTYFYRVHAVAVDFGQGLKAKRGEAVVTELRSFRTLDPAAAEAKITIWNDTHQNQETLKRLIAKHRQTPADFLLWNGDVTNDIPTEELLIKEYLHPAGEAHADQTPLFFSRGNHDVRGRFARQLSHYAPGPEGAYFYSFRQGPVAVVVLDTGEDKPDDFPSYAGLNDFRAHRAAQRAWLERAIAEPKFASAPFKVAIMHIPLFWDKTVPENWLKVWNGHHGWICEDGRKQWHDLLEKAGIRLIISGHTHHPAWFPANAEHRYAQVTGGGPKPDQATTIRLEATAKTMKVTVSNLDGLALFEHDYTA